MSLFTTGTTKPGLKRKLIYLLTLKLITILCDPNQHLIGFRRSRMNTYLAFMPRKLLDNECRYDRLVPRRITHGQFRFFAYIIMPAETYCQADHGINAVGFRKSTKYCDSFRFLKLFCVHFCWEGALFTEFEKAEVFPLNSF